MIKDATVRSWLFTKEGNGLDDKYGNRSFVVNGTLAEAKRFIQREVKYLVNHCNGRDKMRARWDNLYDHATDKIGDLKITMNGQRYSIHGQVNYRERVYTGLCVSLEGRYTMFNMIEVDAKDHGGANLGLKENGDIMSTIPTGPAFKQHLIGHA